MAKAIFHSVRGEKQTSALIGVKANLLVRSWTYCYCGLECIDKDDRVEGTTFNIPDGYTLVDMYNQDGELITSKDGTHLKELMY